MAVMALSGSFSPPKNDTILEVRDLVKRYVIGDGSVLALNGVSLRILAGSMIAITGPSGSGKSTLMNILGCLDTVDSGTYHLASEDVSRLHGDRLAEIRNKYIGFVFQNFNLLARLSALENVELPLLYASRRDARSSAEQALEMVGLKDRMHHEPNQLSGGQRQRVAIARAVATNPAIVLADEPTGNLDSRVGQEILELFHTLNGQGRTIIMVTHDHEVARHCHHEVQIRDGKILTTVEHGKAARRTPILAAV